MTVVLSWHVQKNDMIWSQVMGLLQDKFAI